MFENTKKGIKLHIQASIHEISARVSLSIHVHVCIIHVHVCIMHVHVCLQDDQTLMCVCENRVKEKVCEFVCVSVRAQFILSALKRISEQSLGMTNREIRVQVTESNAH